MARLGAPVKLVIRALLASTLLGCMRSLPPAEPPPSRTRELAPAPSSEQPRRVFLDAAPGRVRVDELMSVNPHDVSVVKDVRRETMRVRTMNASGEARYETQTRPVPVYGVEHVTDRRLVPLCQAPCALQLGDGSHDLHLQGIDDRRAANVRIEVTPTPRTYRVGLGHTLTGSELLTQFFLGFLFLTPGTAVLTAAAVDWAAVGGEPTPADHDRVQSDSVGLTVVGGALLVAGIVGLILVRPTEQPTVVKVDPP
jgi:hypothetical protein